MSTIHNPVNFDPQVYRVVGYIDNKAPEPWPGQIEAWQKVFKAWQDEIRALFPKGNYHRCAHCGNGTVRYVVAADHIPTGERVCLGDICVNRLDIPNRDQFKMKCIRTKASDERKRLARLQQRLDFIAARPMLAAAIEQAKKPEHQGNSFVRDVLNKLDQYGELSERQIECVIGSLARDAAFAAKRAAEPQPVAPVAEGRVEVSGEVLTFKTQESMYGLTTKMLVRLSDLNKIWVTMPSAYDLHKGDKLTMKVTLTRSDKDPHFAFGSRPKILSVAAQVLAAT